MKRTFTLHWIFAVFVATACCLPEAYAQIARKGFQISHQSLVAQGWQHTETQRKIFDPEGLVTQPGNYSMQVVQVDEYKTAFGEGELKMVTKDGLAISYGAVQSFNPPMALTLACVDAPAMDKSWVSGTFEDAVNAAIEDEEIEFGESIGTYIHTSDEPEDILANLRAAYDVAYDIGEVSVERNASMDDIAQNHSCSMDDCDEFCHTCTCDDGALDRLEALGEGPDPHMYPPAVWSYVTSFSPITTHAIESIAIMPGPTVELGRQQAFYAYVYEDVACCNNGHRNMMLDCAPNSNTFMGWGETQGVIPPYSGWIFTMNYATYLGGTWEPPMGTPACAIVPVELVYFRVNEHDCDEIVLEWNTASEIQNEGFEIERSTNGDHWETIGWVPGYQNSIEARNYTFADDSPFLNMQVYYRLKQIDLDGGFEYSPLIVADFAECERNRLNLYPNPTNGYLNVEWNSADTFNIRIFDVKGREIVRIENERKIDLSHLHEGVYMLHFSSGTFNDTRRIIKN